jgi:transposase-like protein
LAGTLFQDTKLPLDLWFQMMWWFMGQKSGASALSLQRNFGVGSYQTAFNLLSKLRSCMVQTGRQRLSGAVEVDEAFLGGLKNKAVIGIAAEIRGVATGRIRLQRLRAKSGGEIHGFITNLIEPGSTIVSDGNSTYRSIIEKGYQHDPKKKPYSWEPTHGDDERLLPRVHRVASLLKRWYLGTYHGRVDKERLQTYLDEFVFRFNRRTSGSRGLVFHRLIEAAVFPKDIKRPT